MGRFMSGLGMVAGVAAIGLVIYAQRRSAQTGKDVMSVLSSLPEELKQTQAEWQKRLRVAVEAGRRAAAVKEAEIDRELGEEPQRSAAAPDYFA